MASGGIVKLDVEQTRKLANLIYLQEVNCINDIQFHSESELAQYLRDCKASHQAVSDVLDAGGDVKAMFQDDPAKAPIAHDTFETLHYGVSFSLQCVRNFVLRLNYLDKVRAHSLEIKNTLKLLDPNDVAAVGRLAKDAARYNRAMLRYTEKYRNFPSKALAYFTEHNINPKDLLSSYQRELGFVGAFEDLEDSQKLQVYNKILAVSEEGEEIMTGFEVIMGTAGIAVLVLTATMMIWDIISSHDKIQTASRDAVQALAPFGGTLVGEVFAATLEIELIGLVEVSSVVIGVIGFGVGIVAGLILGAIGGFILDLIFSGGGSTSPPPPPPPHATDGHIFYRAQMPDGNVLALQIAHL